MDHQCRLNIENEYYYNYALFLGSINFVHVASTLPLEVFGYKDVMCKLYYKKQNPVKIRHKGYMAFLETLS